MSDSGGLKKIRQAVLPALGAGVLSLFLSACATVDYIPPPQGTSADMQISLARALEKNLREIPFDPSGKELDLKVYGLGCFQCASGLEGYVRSLFQEWITSRGGKTGPGGDLELLVYLPALGNLTTTRELSYQNIPIYYSERFQTAARMVVVLKDTRGKTLGLWQSGHGEDSADVFLMRIFGPVDMQAPSP